MHIWETNYFWDNKFSIAHPNCNIFCLALIELGVTTKLKYFSKKTFTYSNIQKFEEKSEHQTKINKL
jgi:hypothetical protein